MTKGYKELIAWQKAMDLAEKIYSLTIVLPREEIYALSGQMRRAAVSVPSNIAEGQQRNTNKEFISFLYIARGSIGELETQLLLCVRLGYLSEAQTAETIQLSAEIGKLLNALIRKLASTHSED